MATPGSPVDVIVVALRTRSDERELLMPASVLASWFEVPVVLVTPEADRLGELESLTRGLGTLTRIPAVADGPSFPSAIVDFLTDHDGTTSERALIVASATDTGFEIARTAPFPTFIPTASSRVRLATGPLVLELAGSSSDTDVLATAAIWSRPLGVGVRIVTEEGPNTEAIDARDRMHALGVDAGIDSLRPHGLDPAVLVARTRMATALIVPQDRIDEPAFARTATREGVSIVVAPTMADRSIHSHHEEWHDDWAEWMNARPAASSHGAVAVELDAASCWDRLGAARVGRIAYLEDGWPTIVPVNFSVDDGAVIIRSLDGGKARAAERDEVVCLEIDGVDLDDRTGWSVLARGHLRVIDDPEALRDAWANDPEPFIASPRWRWLRLEPFTVTGRSLESAAQAMTPAE